MAARRYLLTGGAGFIGAALTRRLVGEGHHVRLLDGVPLEKVTSFEQKLRDEVKATGQEILTAIRTEKEISAATEEKLKAFMENFIKTFV